MAQYAVLIHAADSAPEGSDELREHDRHAQDLESSGGLVAAFALEPAATATTLRADTVTDGPFVDAKEVIAGFYVIEAPDLDAALRIARGNPVLRMGGAVEVRPVAGGYVRPTA
ncbi:YciI family protein [Dactylosporangium sp. CS-047395]|uniref:YciI family protein n=1 Tax=Dactylosporangium sp. CS-047395 TaxID=3239936 RepID=UPI003D89D8FC